MIEIIKAAFSAGEVKTFLIQGEYVEILEAAYPVDVAMMDRSGAQLSTMRNAEASYFSRPGKYEVIQVTSQSAQTVRLFVGSGDAGTRRTSGDVSVVDGGKSRTIAGIAFAGYGSSPGVTANYSHVQLWNPVGNGKKLVVESVRMGSAASTLFYLGFHNVQLAVFDKKARSKKSGGDDSSSDIRVEAAVSLIAGLGILFAEVGSLNISREIKPSEPIIIMPGYGLLVRTGGTNQDIFANFEFYEEAI